MINSTSDSTRPQLPQNEEAVRRDTSWTCRGCNSVVTTAHCPSCGERPLNPRDLTLAGLAEQIVQGLSDFDNRLVRSLKLLVMEPGALTVAYRTGPRNPYVMPFPLFLFANVVFFALQSFTGVKVFSTPLLEHLQSDIWGALAQQLIDRHVTIANTTFEAYAPVFDAAVALNAKSLIILMVFAFAIFPPIVFFSRRVPFAVHVVFAFHLYAFVQLLLSAGLIVVGVDLLFGGVGLASTAFDHAISIGLLVACALHLYWATARVYGATGIGRVLAVALLTVAVAAIVLGYRFILLPITLWTT